MRLARSSDSVLLAAALALVVTLPPAAAEEPIGGWDWPVIAPTVVARFEAPAHEYGAGHRGIDVASSTGDPGVHAPADGVVAFAGAVAGRGVVTIDHGDGLVSTLEPVETQVSAGEAVSRGDVVAVLAAGGHAPAGTLHFGVRRDGAYINPLMLLGGIPRAILLPCC